MILDYLKNIQKNKNIRQIFKKNKNIQQIFKK